MAARLVGLLLGLGLLAVGYLIVRPWGDFGLSLPPIDLVAFEGHRPLIGWGALGLGALAVLTNILPGGRGKARKRAAPMGAESPITFSDDPPPATPVAVAPETRPLTLGAAPEPMPAAAPAQAPEPVAEPVRMSPPPLADTPRQETFGQLRQVLRDRVREEDWSGAGDILGRLPALALTHHDRMLAAQDQGDFLRAQGRNDEAGEAYHQALSYAKLIHEVTPEDPQGAADLAAALVNAGDMAVEEGRLEAAIGAFEDAVTIRRTLVTLRGAQRADRRALSLALERLADTREDRGHRMRALDLYRESLALTGALAAEDPQRYGADLTVTRQRLAELEARLAAV